MKDKSLLRVSGIVSIVVGILYCLTILGIIVGIPLIIGGNKMKELSEKQGPETEEEKTTIIIWAVVFFFLNIISFVLSLLYYLQIKDILGNKENDMSKYEKLEKLKKLYDEKIITKEEYEAEKEKILYKL